MILILLVFCILSPILHIAIGLKLERVFLSLGCQAPQRNTEGPAKLPAGVHYLLGLLLYLWTAFVLKSIGCSWAWSALLPFLPSLFPLSDLKCSLNCLRPPKSLNLASWCLAHLILGASLFHTSDGIATIWYSNYGDLTFHLGMISSFVFGNNVPPEYHLFPGVTLSYPFAINFWTAVQWWIFPTFPALRVIFALQWFIAWLVFYSAVDGTRRPLLPWAVLFGGGSFAAILTAGAAQGGILQEPIQQWIGKGFPWTPFLTSIWITQRTTLLGIGVVAGATVLIQAVLDKRTESSVGIPVELPLAGLLLALSPLAHGHFFLTTVLYLGLLLGFRWLAALSYRTGDAALWFKRALIFCCALLPSLLFAPLLLEKSGIITFTLGWMPWPAVQEPLSFKALAHSTQMWLYNAPFWLLLLLSLWLRTSSRAAAGAISILFLLANMVQIAVWEFDQIKIFIVLYIVSLLELPKATLLSRLLLILLIIPAGLECGRVFLKFPSYTVFTEKQIAQAAQLRSVTPPESVIAGSPDHNSLILLSGRRLWLGYDGTLHSHGLDFKKRQEMNAALEPIFSCRSLPKAPCPGYLLWTEREQRYWQRSAPGEQKRLEPLIEPFLFRITVGNSNE